MKTNNWKKVSDEFISKYYDFFELLAGKIEGLYYENLSKWLINEGSMYFEKVDGMLVDRLDNRVEGFANRYDRVMRRAFDECDYDKLLDYLYFIPGEMLKEFKAFKFIPDKITVTESEVTGYDIKVPIQGALLSSLFS